MTNDDFNRLAYLTIHGILGASNHEVITPNGLFQRAPLGWTPERNHDHLLPGVNSSSLLLELEDSRRLSKTRTSWIEPHAICFVTARDANGQSLTPLGGPVIYMLTVSGANKYGFAEDARIPTLEALALDRLSDVPVLDFAGTCPECTDIRVHVALRGFGKTVQVPVAEFKVDPSSSLK